MQTLSVSEIQMASGGLSKDMNDFVGTVFGAAAGADLAIAGAQLGAWGGPLGAAIGTTLGFGLAWGLNHLDGWTVATAARKRQ